MELCEIEDMLPEKAVAQICTSGDNTEACEYWARLLNPKILKYDMIRMLEPYGAWSISEMYKETKFELLVKCIWCAAWNCFECREDMENS